MSAIPNEQVYLMRIESGWGEHAHSILDDLDPITPETIKEALTKMFDLDCPLLTTLESWLEEQRDNAAANLSVKDIFIWESEECPTCGHDPEYKYELRYEADEHTRHI